MKILNNVLKITGCIVLIIVVVIVIRTLTIPSKQVKVDNTNLNINLDMDKASRNLSHALQFKTISYTDPVRNLIMMNFQDYVNSLMRPIQM